MRIGMCVSRDCGWSAVLSHSFRDDTVPRCVRGASMKRSTLAPVFSYLDFLRDEDSLPRGTSSDRDGNGKDGGIGRT
jgi:hypothetical protein